MTRGTELGGLTTVTVSFVLSSDTPTNYKTLRDACIAGLVRTEQDLTIKHDAVTILSRPASQLWLVNEPRLVEPMGDDKSPISGRFEWTVTFNELIFSQQGGDDYVLSFTDEIKIAPSGLKNWTRSGTLITNDDGGSASTQFETLLSANNANLKTPTGYVRTRKNKKLDERDRNLQWELVWDQRKVLPISGFNDFVYSFDLRETLEEKMVVISGTLEAPSTANPQTSLVSWLDKLESHFSGHPVVSGSRLMNRSGVLDELHNILQFTLEYAAGARFRPLIRFAESILSRYDAHKVDHDLLGEEPLTFTQQVAHPSLTILVTGVVESVRPLEGIDLSWILAPPDFVEREWKRGPSDLSLNVPLFSRASLVYRTSWAESYRVPAEEVETTLVEGIPFADLILSKFR